MNGIVIENDDLKVTVRRDVDGLITSGLVLDDITFQRCDLIIRAQKGEFKEHPTLGFGIESYLRRPLTVRQEFINNMQTELKSDAFANAKVIVNQNDLSDFKVEL
ncbi:MAG: hypothetical protein P1P63_04955 [Treponemataceae bacterium]